jgi:hypothetical protein
MLDPLVLQDVVPLQRRDLAVAPRVGSLMDGVQFTAPREWTRADFTLESRPP